MDALAVHLLHAIEDAGGFVTVNDRTFVRRSVLRDVLLAASRQLCAEMIDQLTPIVDGHYAPEDMRADVGNIVRKLEKKINEILPVLN